MHHVNSNPLSLEFNYCSSIVQQLQQPVFILQDCQKIVAVSLNSFSLLNVLKNNEIRYESSLARDQSSGQNNVSLNIMNTKCTCQTAVYLYLVNYPSEILLKGHKVAFALLVGGFCIVLKIHIICQRKTSTCYVIIVLTCR